LAEVVEVTPGSQAELRRRVILGSSWLRLGSPSLWCLGHPRQGRCRSRQRG
jgi:hypothetical protein